MKRYLVVAMTLILATGAVWAIGRGGGGGGRGGGGGARPAGGGGARPSGGVSRPASRPAPAPHPTPSFSGGGARPAARPSPPQNRPSPPQVSRPSGGPRPGLVPGNGPSQPTARPPQISNGPVNRPNVPSNPGIRPPQISNGPANRPNLPNQPRPTPLPHPGGAGGAIGGGAIGGGGIAGGGKFPDRPNFPQQPVRPPNFGQGGNRPNFDNPYLKNGNINAGNTINAGNNFNRSNTNVTNNFNRGGNTVVAGRPNYPGYGYGHPYPPSYRPNWNHWNQGYWNWYNRPGAWFGAGAAFGWLLAPGQTVAYANPYYVTVPQEQIVYDYSQPIVMTAPAEAIAPVDFPIPTPVDVTPPAPAPTDVPPATVTDDSNAEAIRNFDAAREAFKINDYPKALDLVNAAIKLQPGDGSLHEFRGLVLFATKQYQDASATEYSVLAAGPGWNWDTVKSLYDSPATYAQQLRDLEAFQKANPTLGYASFLLAYHYLLLDAIPQATTQLENAVARTPNDELSKLLLKSLKDQQDRPTPGQ